ncbi:uncharacterized protein LOC124673567 [Lolium rigidum]|uniref:uncharacterized protein LOC124673567 n=1 Tax=Lolium rigidum TaxID=89674 RepID=UPI001F5C4DE1|nr:uncharacterized protein LOC124673567 [Lolium rigidum]
MNGCGSDISHSQRRFLVGGGGGLTFFCPDEAWQGLVDLMSKNGCGSFAGLLSATANAAEIFHEHLLGGSGLTVFCPDDKAVAAFDPTFRTLAADDRLSVLLYHGVAACYGRERFKGFNYVSVNTLAEDAATKKNQPITVLDEGGALELWPAPPSYPNGAAWVTKTASEEAPPRRVPCTWWTPCCCRARWRASGIWVGCAAASPYSRTGLFRSASAVWQGVWWASCSEF